MPFFKYNGRNVNGSERVRVLFNVSRTNIELSENGFLNSAIYCFAWVCVWNAPFLYLFELWLYFAFLFFLLFAFHVLLLLSPRHSVYLFDRFESLEIAKVVLVLKSFFSLRSLGNVTPSFGPCRQNGNAFNLTNGDDSWCLRVYHELWFISSNISYAVRSNPAKYSVHDAFFLKVRTGVSSSLHSYRDPPACVR